MLAQRLEAPEPAARYSEIAVNYFWDMPRTARYSNGTETSPILKIN